MTLLCFSGYRPYSYLAFGIEHRVRLLYCLPGQLRIKSISFLFVYVCVCGGGCGVGWGVWGVCLHG